MSFKDKIDNNPAVILLGTTITAVILAVGITWGVFEKAVIGPTIKQKDYYINKLKDEVDNKNKEITKKSGEYIKQIADLNKQNEIKDHKINRLTIEIKKISEDSEKQISHLKEQVKILNQKLSNPSKGPVTINDFHTSPAKDSSTLYPKYTTKNSEVTIHLTEPNAEIIKNSNEIQIVGRIEINSNKNVNKYLKEKKLVLIPVLESGEYTTYREIPVNNDGTFRNSWSGKSAKDCTFWVGLFSYNSKIKPNEIYYGSSSPNKYAEYSSNRYFLKIY